MSGDHHHSMTNKNVLGISFVIITTFMVIEFIGGLMTNSLALLSDAGHMLSDSIALGVGLIAFKLGERAVTETKTFGYHRAEILSALFNGILLLLISAFIMWESFERLENPQPIAGTGMLIVATIGAIVNIIVAMIFMKADISDNINMKAIFLHVMGDLLGSIGAILASILIMFYGWNIADPIASLVVSIIILKSGIKVTSDAVHVLMEGKPEHLNIRHVKEKLLTIPGVVDIQNFHAWSITSNTPIISCHLVISGNYHDMVLEKALKELHDTFNIEHATIQVERLNVKEVKQHVPRWKHSHQLGRSKRKEVKVRIR